MKSFKHLFFCLICLLPLTTWAFELKVLSWNVYLIPKPVKWSYQEKRIPLLSKTLSTANHDLIFLQEAFMGSFRDHVAKKLSKKYPYRSYLGMKAAIPLVGSGVYILSKYPYRILDNIHFRECKGSDCWAKKGASFIEVTLPGRKKAQFGVTHMQAGGSAKSEEVRYTQAMQMKAVFKRFKSPGIPQFLVGDLNVDANNNKKEFDRVRALLQMNTQPLSGNLHHTGGFPIGCYNKSVNTKKWIDHLLVSDNVRNVTVERRVRAFTGKIRGRECPLSDHYALEATIKLPMNQMSPVLTPLKLANQDE